MGYRPKLRLRPNRCIAWRSSTQPRLSVKGVCFCGMLAYLCAFPVGVKADFHYNSFIQRDNAKSERLVFKLRGSEPSEFPDESLPLSRLLSANSSADSNSTVDGPSFVGVCEIDDAKRYVEESPGYIGYQLVFWLGYGLVAGWSVIGVYTIYQQMLVKARGRIVNLCDNNRAVVLATIAIGAIVRALSFIDLTLVYNGCVGEEILRCIKDVCFLMSFLLIVLFWVELQSSISYRGNIDAYRPVLYAVLGSYSTVRILNAIFELAIRDPSWPATLTNVIAFVIYLGVMVVAAIYGGQLICKIQNLGGQGEQAEYRESKAARMTGFMVAEMAVLLLLALVFGLRQTAFSDASTDNPWLWFWLKVVEKVFELASIGILCAVMARQADAKNSDSGEGGGTGKLSGGTSRRNLLSKQGSKHGLDEEGGNDALALTQEERDKLQQLPPSRRGAAKLKIMQVKRRALADAGTPVEVTLSAAEEVKLKTMPPSKRGAARNRMLRLKRAALEGREDAKVGSGGAGGGKLPKRPPGKGGAGRADSRQESKGSGRGGASVVPPGRKVGMEIELTSDAKNEADDVAKLMLNEVGAGALNGKDEGTGVGLGPGRTGGASSEIEEKLGSSGNDGGTYSRVRRFFGSLFQQVAGTGGSSPTPGAVEPKGRARNRPRAVPDSVDGDGDEDPLMAQRRQTYELLAAVGNLPVGAAAMAKVGVGVWVYADAGGAEGGITTGGRYYFPLLLPTLVYRRHPHGFNAAREVVAGSANDPVAAAIPLLYAVLEVAVEATPEASEDEIDTVERQVIAAPRVDPAVLKESACSLILRAIDYERLGRLLRSSIAAARRGGAASGPSSLSGGDGGGSAVPLGVKGMDGKEHGLFGSVGNRARSLSRGRRSGRGLGAGRVNPLQVARDGDGGPVGSNIRYSIGKHRFAVAARTTPGSSFSLGRDGAQLYVKKNPLRQSLPEVGGAGIGNLGGGLGASTFTSVSEGRHWPGAELPRAPVDNGLPRPAGSLRPSREGSVLSGGSTEAACSGAGSVSQRGSRSGSYGSQSSRASLPVPKPGTKIRIGIKGSSQGPSPSPSRDLGSSEGKRPGPPRPSSRRPLIPPTREGDS